MNTPKLYLKYNHLITDNLFFSPHGDHGVGHAKRVLWLATTISEHYELLESEQKIIALSCCYHDIGRTNDYTNPSHGKDSAEKVLQLRLLDNVDLSNKEIERILDLITMHSLDDSLYVRTERETLLYQILKDADALDRVRFDDLDTRYLRLERSKNMVNMAKELCTKIRN